jgi:zinc transport system substrate-binding protein
VSQPSAVALAAIIALALVASGCRRAPAPGSGASDANAPGAGSVRTVVSIQPQACFVERVGGPRVVVDVLVGQGQSPHLYEPTPRQIAALSQAQVYFSIGMEFEQRLLEKISRGHGHLRVVDTRRGIELRAPDADCLHARRDDAEVRLADGDGRSGGHDSPGHAGCGEHGEGDEHAQRTGEGSAGGGQDTEPAGGGRATHTHHEHSLPDPHIWLSPRLVQVQAGTIADALIEIDPAHREEYEANLAAFVRELEELDAQIAQRLAAARGGEFLVFHPSYGYFADAYGLRQVPIEVSGKEPSARELARIVEHAKAHGARAVLLEPQYAPTAAEAVARAIGGSVVLVDPLARDYFAMMRDLAEKVARALGAGLGGPALRMGDLSPASGGAS